MGIISLADIMGKSSFLEQPRTILLEQQLQEEIKKARTTCDRQGIRSEECGAAWDVVDYLQSELAHQRAERVVKTAFDEFCDEFPEARDARRGYMILGAVANLRGREPESRGSRGSRESRESRGS